MECRVDVAVLKKGQTKKRPIQFQKNFAGQAGMWVGENS
jgi:hypothetical protein